MCPARLILCMVFSAVPPLTDDQRVRLDTAYDGRDHQEDAFVALLDNVRQWTPGMGDAAVRLHPDLYAMLADPDAYRGELCRIVGSIQQQTRLAWPHDGVVEWFIRNEAGPPILVYVDGLEADHPFRDGQQVMLLARFYKRVDAVARDGKVHQYPAFVGAFPRRLGAGDEAWTRLWAMVVPVAVMLVVFLLLLIYARRGRRPAWRIGRRAVEPGGGVDGRVSLPDDPAEALAQLRRRAEEAD